MNKEKVKGFVGKHKKKLIAAGAVVGGVVIYSVCKKVINKDVVKMPGFKIEEGLTIADLGKLGEEYMKHDAELKPDTPVLEIGKFVFG